MDSTISSFIANAIAAPEFLMGLVATAFLVLFIPWKSNFKPLNALLNSADDKKDPLAKSWREQKLGELTFVGVSVDISPFLTVSLANKPVVRHRCQYCHWRDCLAARPFNTRTALDHNGELVLESDPGVDGYQQRDAAELSTLPSRLL